MVVLMRPPDVLCGLQGLLVVQPKHVACPREEVCASGHARGNKFVGAAEALCGVGVKLARKGAPALCPLGAACVACAGACCCGLLRRTEGTVLLLGGACRVHHHALLSVGW